MSARYIMFSVTSPGELGPSGVNKVAQLALGLEAELELFHCVFETEGMRRRRFGAGGARKEIQASVDHRREELECTAERFRAKGVRVRTSVRWDYPVHEGIVRQVLRCEPLLLVAQSSRRGRAARLMLTQTDYRLIETCPCTVLLIKSERPYLKPVIVAAVDPGRSHDKPATLDEKILDAAVMIRDALGGELKVFHAGVPWDGAGKDELRDLPEGVKEDVHGAYWRKLEAPVRELARRHNIPESSLHVMEGQAAELLPLLAVSQSAHMVAMGAVSRTRIERALIGHTAERVLDVLECDLLVVKPPEFQTPVRHESMHQDGRGTALHDRLAS